jgi:hypothetical protein
MISATAHDSAGNDASDNDTTVTVSAVVADTTPPIVTITVPEDGATVSGLIRVTIDATDDVGVKTALLFLGEAQIGADYRAPFEVLWDTATFPEGATKLTARVFDEAGNVGLDEIDVTVSSEPVVIGRKYWGCSTSGAMPGDAVAIYLLLLAGAAFASRRRGARPISSVALALGLSVGFGLGVSACGGEDIVINGGRSNTGKNGNASRISSYLEGKTLTMEGTSIPSHPNGYDEHVNFGQATQCYHKVTMTPLAGRYHVVSELGTLMNAPNPGTRGECERTMMSAELSFDSTAVLVENVRDNGGCFDFTVTYPGFGQEGRGSLSEDGGTLVLELFFKDQATGHRCGDGEVGDPTVTLSQMPFTGDARQTYSVTE